MCSLVKLLLEVIFSTSNSLIDVSLVKEKKPNITMSGSRLPPTVYKFTMNTNTIHRPASEFFF